MKAVYSASLANLFHVTVFGRELARADGEAAGRIRAPGAAPGWAAGSTLPAGRLRGLRAPGALGYVLGTLIPPPVDVLGGWVWRGGGQLEPLTACWWRWWHRGGAVEGFVCRGWIGAKRLGDLGCRRHGAGRLLGHRWCWLNKQEEKGAAAGIGRDERPRWRRAVSKGLVSTHLPGVLAGLGLSSGI